MWFYSFQNVFSTQVGAESSCGGSSSKHQSLITERLSPIEQRTTRVSKLGEILLVKLLMQRGASLFQKPGETGDAVRAVYKRAELRLLIAQQPPPQRQRPRKILYQPPAAAGVKRNLAKKEATEEERQETEA